MRAFALALLEVLEIALVTIGAVIAIRYFLVQPFLVSGGSMDPTFTNGDYLLIDQLTYRFREPERGEVVVFKNEQGTYFIKRVIGLPGETVKVEDGSVRISSTDTPKGFTLEEAYLPSGLPTAGSSDVTLGEGEYFVMGDNRAYSYDSRSWGAIPDEEIIGVVRVRLWPLTHAKAFFAPEYAPTR
jgi:signal peptidase I